MEGSKVDNDFSVGCRHQGSHSTVRILGTINMNVMLRLALLIGEQYIRWTAGQTIHLHRIVTCGQHSDHSNL